MVQHTYFQSFTTNKVPQLLLKLTRVQFQVFAVLLRNLMVSIFHMLSQKAPLFFKDLILSKFAQLLTHVIVSLPQYFCGLFRTQTGSRQTQTRFGKVTFTKALHQLKVLQHFQITDVLFFSRSETDWDLFQKDFEDRPKHNNVTSTFHL